MEPREKLARGWNLKARRFLQNGLQARHFQAVESSVFPANPFRSKPSLIFLPKLGNGGILVTSWFVCVVIA